MPGQVVYLKGGALRGMKAGNYTGHLVGHAGRQALHGTAHLPPLGTRVWPTRAQWTGRARGSIRLSAIESPFVTAPHRPSCTRWNPRSWRSCGRALKPPCATCRRRSTRAASKIRAYTTLLTVMTRLDGKGLLVRRRAGRLDVYAPAIARDAYLQARAEAEVAALVEDFGDLALAHFARHIGGLDPERLEKLRGSPRGD